MDCLSNLNKCHASCCRYLVFYGKNLSDDIQNYYKVHGCKLLRMNREMWQIVVPVTCGALKDDLCTLHGTDQKPRVCLGLNEKTKENYYITEGCLLEGK